MLEFNEKPWSQQIAEITGSEEYQTCEITIINPNLVTSEFDYATNSYPDSDEGIIYEGQARLIAVRRGVNYEGANQNNSKVLTAIRVQVPGGSLPQRLLKGFIGIVTSAPLNPTLETYQFYLASDVHGASAATRTLEFNLDGDSVHD